MRQRVILGTKLFETVARGVFVLTCTYRLPLVVHVQTYLLAAAIVIAAAVASGALVRRRIDHLDLIAVLKTRE